MHPVTILFNFLQRSDFLITASRPNMTSREAAEWYPDWIYEIMETDETRNSQYRAIIDKHVSDKIVLELGTGRKALWARYCAERGAKRVYAIEANQGSYQSSKKIIENNGLGQITLVQGFSDQVSIPEPCDLFVHDVIGSIGSSEGIVPYIEDIKTRMLKPSAIHIPSRCSTYFFPSVLPQHTPLESAFNLALRGGRRLSTLSYVLMFGFRPEAMLAEPKIFEDLNFRETLPLESNLRTEFRVDKDGLWDAVCFYIRLAVDDSHIVDSLHSRTNWFLPYVRPFKRPIPVRKGDTILLETITHHKDASPIYRLVCHHGSGKTLQIVADHSWSGT